MVEEGLHADAEVLVGGLADGVAGLSGELLNPGGALGDGASVRGGGQGQRGSEGGPDAGLVEVDAAAGLQDGRPSMTRALGC